MALPHLLDTNTLLRLASRDDPQHRLVESAVNGLLKTDTSLFFTPQNAVEFWNVLTRPRGNNGFGLTIEEADRETSLLERQFQLLPDTHSIYPEWRRLVVAHSVSGAKVHDARLVAAMLTHGIRHVLTLNIADFVRYPEITAIHPRDVG